MEQENGAIYCRLSQDDGSAGESGSIQTQKTLLTGQLQLVNYMTFSTILKHMNIILVQEVRKTQNNVEMNIQERPLLQM